MILKWLFAAILLYATTSLSAEAKSEASQVRLALLAATEEASALSDLLMTQLTTNPQIHLLEREQIGKIYREQALSAANRNYINLGRVAGAQGLIVLETSNEGTNKFLQLRLIAVNPGVILAAQRFSMPLERPEQWAVEVAKHLEPSMPKLEVPLKDAVPISILNLRSALQSAEARDLERQLTILTIERLSRERQVFVLERRKLQSLSEEINLNGLEDAAFWNGSYLLDATIDPEGHSKERMTVRARLSAPGTNSLAPVEVSCARGDLSEAVNQLAGGVLAAVKVAGMAAPWHAADEAERFFAEATWARRWELYPQAQSAIESAWALGKRTREAAELRVRAYAEAWRIDEGLGNLVFPAVPDPIALGPAARALETYCRSTPMLFTNGAPMDEDWFATGLRTIRGAASLLDGFYHTAELREANEEKLAELRSLVRESLGLMSNQPLLDWRLKGLPVLYARKIPWRDSRGRGIQELLGKFESILWNQGGILHEKPEDSVPIFRRMIERGYIPDALPRFAGWAWEDRKRIPRVRRQFIQEVCSSTNVGIKVPGLLLDLMQTPYYPQEGFQAREAALLQGIWDHRDWILSGSYPPAVLSMTDSVLKQRHGQLPESRLEQVAELRHRLRKEFMLYTGPINMSVFDALFRPGVSESCTPSEARELTPLVETVSRTNSWYAGVAASFRKQAGLPQLDSPAVDARPSVSPEKVLATRFTTWNLDDSRNGFQARPEVTQVVVRENKFCARIVWYRPNAIGFVYPSSYLIADPAAGTFVEVQFPEKTGYPDSGLELTKDSLFVSVQKQIYRYKFSEGTWDSIPIPTDQGAEIIDVAGHLFLSTRDNLLEVSPGSKEVQIIASSRREPAVNEMDLRLGSGTHSCFRAGDKLGVRPGGREVFTFAPSTQLWERLSILPMISVSQTVPFMSQAGLQFLLRDQYISQRVIAVWFDSGKPELLLEKRGRMKEPSVPELASPRWVWPEPYPAERSCPAAEGKSLWLLIPRTIRHFGKEEQPVVFQDDRHASVLHFTPEFNQAECAPIRFDKEGQPADPFDPKVAKPRFFGGSETTPFWLAMPHGSVAISPGLLGHWFISKSSLEGRMQRLDARAAAATQKTRTADVLDNQSTTKGPGK